MAWYDPVTAFVSKVQSADWNALVIYLRSHASDHQAGGLQPITLDTLAPPSDTTSLNASTSAHGLLKKLDGNPAHYLDGTGTFSTPPNTGNVNGPSISVSGDIPSFSDATGKNIGDSGILAANVVLTGDARLSNARTPTPHKATHGSTGSDPVTIAESQVTGLVADLASKALASAIPTVDTVAPQMNGTAAIGSHGKFADGGHVHPTDATRAADSTVFHIATAGEINAETTKTTPAGADVILIEDSAASFAKKKILVSSLPTGSGNVVGPASATAGHLATFADATGKVLLDGGTLPAVPAIDTINPTMNGTASPGSNGKLSDSGHVHPTDTSRAAVSAIPVVDTVVPQMNGTAAIGSHGKFADGGHVHPTDTTRQPALTNPVTAAAVAMTVGDVVTATGTGNQVQDSGTLLSNLVLTGDARLANARTPTAHASTHKGGGTDPLLPSDTPGYLYDDGSGNLSWQNVGSATDQNAQLMAILGW
jgi:hypothetical protein